MSKTNHRNPFFKFLSPYHSTHNNKEQEYTNYLNITREVSGRKRVEETFRMLEIAVEQSIDGVAVADRDGIICFCNHTWAHMHGYHVYEVIGKHLSIFHTKEQMETDVIPFNEQVIKNGAHHGEVGHVKKDGTTFNTWMSTTLFKDEKGKPIGLVGIARDITERKKAQIRLLESEEKYRNLFENSIGAIGISKGNRVVAANKSLLDIFGYESLEEFLKVPLLYHVAIESREMIRERMKKRQKGEYVTPRFEYKIIRKNGEIRDIDACSTEIILGNEKYVQTTFRDITEQKKIEMELRTSEAKYQDLYHNAPDVFLSVDAKTAKIIECNQTMLQVTGYTREEIIGRSIFDMCHPDCIEEAKKTFRQFTTTGEVRNKELCIKKKDGSKIEISLNVSAVRDDKGNIVYSRSVWRDITERKKFENRITKINNCLLNFDSDPDKNINNLVALCGEIMGATSALYSRIKQGIIHSIGMWNVPQDHKAVDKADGHICYDMIKLDRNEFYIVRNLLESSYALNDPNVVKYQLQTYIGLPVKFGSETIGALCVVYQKDFLPNEDDKKFMQIIASAIAVEEKRRQSEEKIRENWEKYKTLTDNISVGVYRVTGEADGRFIEANPAIIRMFGYDTKEEFLSKKVCDLYQHSQETEKFSKKLLTNGFVKNEELLLKKRDGSSMIGSVSAVVIKDQNGQIKYVDGIIEDVTQEKRIEKALRNSELQYRTTLDSISDAIHVVDKGLRIILLNKFFKEWNERLGLETEVVGKTIFEVFPFLSERVRDQYRKVFETGEIVVTEEHNRIKDREFVTEVRKIPIFKDGKIEQVMTVIRDISERKKAEKILIEKERFLFSVFESIQDGISILDKEMRIVKVNSAIEKWYQYAMPLVGKKCYEAYHGRLKQCVICPTIKTLQTGKSAYEVVPKVGKDGKVVGWLDLYTFPLIDTQTNLINGVIEYVRDITERKLAEEKSEKLNKELFKTNRRLRHLALRDSHTGLYNHRYLQEAIESEFCRAKRYDYPLSVIMLDLDYFKSINDVYSHQFGDLVLKQFGRKLKRMVRRYDTVIRYGGEEFIIISSGMNKSMAIALAHRIFEDINFCNFGNKEHSVRLKFSIGVVSYPEDKIAKGMDLIELVDRILNRAKEDGGDRVYSYIDIKKEKRPLEVNREKVDVKFLKEKIERLNKRANQSLIESVFAFARTIKLKDHYTGEHVENTVYFATEIAKKIGFHREEVENIRRAAMVHDLGKIGVSERILLKKSRLTKKEFVEIKKHPQIGADILRPIHFFQNIIPLIQYHHERWDGKGYPFGLKKEEIPIGARIIAIADVFQALISDRPYRGSYSRSKAQKIIQEGAGTQFDPKIVDIFLKIL